MATKDRALCRSLQNQTIGIKAWVHTTEYHPIQQTPGKDTLLHSLVEPSETHHSGQIKKDQPQKDLHLRARGTLGLPPPVGRPHRQTRRWDLCHHHRPEGSARTAVISRTTRRWRRPHQTYHQPSTATDHHRRRWNRQTLKWCRSREPAATGSSSQIWPPSRPTIQSPEAAAPVSSSAGGTRCPRPTRCSSRRSRRTWRRSPRRSWLHEKTKVRRRHQPRELSPATSVTSLFC
jgi:hypothetical protein